MTPKAALKLVLCLQKACSLLAIHGLLPDSERDRVRARVDKWALKHGLRRKDGGA